MQTNLIFSFLRELTLALSSLYEGKKKGGLLEMRCSTARVIGHGIQTFSLTYFFVQ